MVFPGDVVVAPLAQVDGGAKPGPVLLLRELPGFGDYLACGISWSLLQPIFVSRLRDFGSQMHQAIKGFDLILSPGSSEFVSAGLHTESVVRLGFVGVVPVRKMTRRLGRLSPSALAELQKRLADHIFPGQ
jgi:mRNA interferase MazF